MEHRSWLAAALLVACGCSAPPPPLFQQRLDEADARAAAFLPPAEPVPLSAAPDLAELWAAAQRGNPGLRAAYHRWRAELEAAGGAGELPQPRLGIGAFLSAVETRSGPMRGRIGLSQALPWFGTTAAAQDRALAAAEAAREDFEAARTALRAELAHAWLELHDLQRTLETTRAHRELLVHLEAVSRVRYESGSGGHGDLIRAQVELAQLEDRLAELEDLRAPSVARLEALLGRPAGEPLPWPADELPASPGLPEGLESGLAQSHPGLRALAARAEAARHGVVLAEKAYHPAWTVGAEWTWIGEADDPAMPDSGKDAVALTLGVELPLRRGRLDAGLAAARAREAETADRAADLERRLGAELALVRHRHRDAARRVALYREGLVAKSEEAFETTLTGYQAATAPFDSVIDAARHLLEFQLAQAHAEIDLVQAAVDAERATGLVLLPF